MSLKDFDQLAYEIDQAVHVNGPLGKTTAPGLNNLLKSLATELTAVPETLGGAAVQALSQAEAARRQREGELHPGATYRIGSRSGAALGSSGDVLVQAVAADAFGPEGVLCARVPDYATHPVWPRKSLVPPPPPGALLDTTYVAQTTTYVPLVAHQYEAIDRHAVGDDNVYAISLPFPFTFGGVTYEECAIDTNGRVVFGSGNYATVGGGVLGSSNVPMIAFAWSDLVVSPALFGTFVTGEAPYRKFVLDYNRAHLFKRWLWGGDSYDTQDTITGQLVLEETTNRISLGIAANTNPDQNVGHGLQYAGHAYPLYAGQMLPNNVQTTFTPVYQHAGDNPPAGDDPTTVLWRGRTWQRDAAADFSQEPGTGPAWVPYAGPGADEFGNARPAYDPVRYDVATDRVAERRDDAGNHVRGESGLRGFPWGHPAAQANRVLDCTLDDSLLTTPDLRLRGNLLMHSQLTRVQLGGLDVADNNFYNLALTDYAPARLDRVTAYYGLDQALPGLSQQLFVGGRSVRDALPTLDAGLAAFKGRYLDAGFITYRAGQAPSFAPLDVLEPFNSDFTAHDLIEIRGSFQDKQLCLRNQDYRICGNAIFSSLLPGSQTQGRQIQLNGLTFLNGISIQPAARGNVGHRQQYVNCTLGPLSYYGGGNGQLCTYHFAHCRISRFANLWGQPYQQTVFENCVFGLGLTAGSVFGGSRGAGSGPLVVANSTIVLQGTATLFDPGFDQTYAPTFENVTVVAADGTVSHLPAPAAPAPAPPAAAPGLEVVAQATFAGTVPAGGMVAPPLTQAQVDARPAATNGGWDQEENGYRVPLTGLYEITTTLRLPDNALETWDYALGAGSKNEDLEQWLEWASTAPVKHVAAQTSRLAQLAAEEVIYPAMRSAYDIDKSVTITLTLKLLQRGPAAEKKNKEGVLTAEYTV